MNYVSAVSAAERWNNVSAVSTDQKETMYPQ